MHNSTHHSQSVSQPARIRRTAYVPFSQPVSQPASNRRLGFMLFYDFRIRSNMKATRLRLCSRNRCENERTNESYERSENIHRTMNGTVAVNRLQLDFDSGRVQFALRQCSITIFVSNFRIFPNIFVVRTTVAHIYLRQLRIFRILEAKAAVVVP